MDGPDRRIKKLQRLAAINGLSKVLHRHAVDLSLSHHSVNRNGAPAGGEVRVVGDSHLPVPGLELRTDLAALTPDVYLVINLQLVKP